MSKELTDGMWKGQAAVLVGGGASLRGFDWERLERWKRAAGPPAPFRKVCIINDAIHSCGHFADLLFWMDREQYDYRKTEFDLFRGLKVAYSYGERENRGPAGTAFLPGKAVEGISDALGEGLCHGNDSGYALLNLAYLLGASPIYLLGYDGGPIGGETHWHHAPRDPANAEVYEERFARARAHFENYGRGYAERGAEVVNLNPASRIEVFPKLDPDEVLPRRVGPWVLPAREFKFPTPAG